MTSRLALTTALLVAVGCGPQPAPKDPAPPPPLSQPSGPRAFERAWDEGVELFGQNDYDGARRAFERAKVINPFKPAVWRYLAEIALKQGRLRACTDAVTQALLLDPDSEETTELARRCQGVSPPEPSPGEPPETASGDQPKAAPTEPPETPGAPVEIPETPGAPAEPPETGTSPPGRTCEDVVGSKTANPMALVLLIDRSGSMSGLRIEMAKRAAIAALGVLRATDLLGVVAFDSQASVYTRLQPAANSYRIKTEIGRLQAGGGTNIYPALREANEILANAKATTKHVILFSDGHASYDGIKDLVNEIAKNGITISTVGLGDFDRNLLGIISKGGHGRFYDVRDPANLPAVLAEETLKACASTPAL